MKMRNFLFILIFGLMMFGFGCTEPVPAGHIGRNWVADGGFIGPLLAPGRHSSWGRDVMYYMETTDQNLSIPMDILVADNLNFSFSIDVLVGVNLENQEVVKSAFENLKPISGTTFTVEQLFQTYILPVADQEARKVVSKYTTEEIVKKRAQIIEEVVAAVTSSSKTSILKVKRVAVRNLDFPDVITKAQEERKKKEVEIDTARAEARRLAAQAEGRITIARIEAQEKLLRAQAQADGNRILAASVSPQLIMWRQWDVMESAAGGANNMFLIPYTDAANGGLDASKWLSPQGILDAKLLERIQEATHDVGTPFSENPPEIEE